VRYVIVTVKGAGTQDDAIRADFPTYEMIAGPLAGKALIGIPDDDWRDAFGDLPASQTQLLSAWLTDRGLGAQVIARIVAQYGDPLVTVALTPAALARLNARLDARYREHAGRFRPIVG
jgi:hypothetical protein